MNYCQFENHLFSWHIRKKNIFCHLNPQQVLNYSRIIKPYSGWFASVRNGEGLVFFAPNFFGLPVVKTLESLRTCLYFAAYGEIHKPRGQLRGNGGFSQMSILLPQWGRGGQKFGPPKVLKNWPRGLWMTPIYG